MFDIDRTVTSYNCPSGTKIPGAIDNAYGCHETMEIAQDAKNTVDWCKNKGCEVAIATDSTATTDFDSKLSTTQGRDAFKDVFSGTKVGDQLGNYRLYCGNNPPSNSLCRSRDDGFRGIDKGNMTKSMIDNAKLRPNNVYFFDDSSDNRSQFCSYMKPLFPDVNLYATDPVFGGHSQHAGECSTESNCGLSGNPNISVDDLTKCS